MVFDARQWSRCGSKFNTLSNILKYGLTSLQSKMAEFLGDPRFPEKAMRTNSRALKIEYFQELYKLYSRLSFSRYEDRPFAIAGLEKRLRRAFDTRGGYGVFDDGNKPERGLFHRSILWQSGEKNGLELIEFPAERNIYVPTWSWMAYKGAIDYVDIPGGSADWETNDIEEPWTRGQNRGSSSAPQDGIIGISVVVRDYTVIKHRKGEIGLTYDLPDRTRGSDGQRAQCVVVAKSTQARKESGKRYYVLLVAPTQITSGGKKIYHRLGAGYLADKHVDMDAPGVKAELQ